MVPLGSTGVKSLKRYIVKSGRIERLVVKITAPVQWQNTTPLEGLPLQPFNPEGIRGCPSASD
jgi:hypothetical protein